MKAISWLDIHKKRMEQNGATISENYSNQTAGFINVAFADSPTFLKVFIGEQSYDARLITEKKFTVASGYEAKKLILRPYTKMSVGKIVVEKDERKLMGKWLVVFFEDRELEPKAHIRFCNNVITLKNGVEVPCIVDNKITSAQKIKEEIAIDLPTGTLKLTIGYDQNTKLIKENDRFVINGTAWEVQDFDRYVRVYNEEGIIELAVKKVPLKEGEVIAGEEGEDELSEPSDWSW